jgi:hypothetical protein
MKKLLTATTTLTLSLFIISPILAEPSNLLDVRDNALQPVPNCLVGRVVNGRFLLGITSKFSRIAEPQVDKQGRQISLHLISIPMQAAQSPVDFALSPYEGQIISILGQQVEGRAFKNGDIVWGTRIFKISNPNPNLSELSNMCKASKGNLY